MVLSSSLTCSGRLWLLLTFPCRVLGVPTHSYPCDLFLRLRPSRRSSSFLRRKTNAPKPSRGRTKKKKTSRPSLRDVSLSEEDSGGQRRGGGTIRRSSSTYRSTWVRCPRCRRIPRARRTAAPSRCCSDSSCCCCTPGRHRQESWQRRRGGRTGGQRQTGEPHPVSVALLLRVAVALQDVGRAALKVHAHLNADEEEERELQHLLLAGSRPRLASSSPYCLHTWSPRSPSPGRGRPTPG